MAERSRLLSLLLLLAPVALGAGTGQRSEDQPRPDLSGAWSLNRELSTLAPPVSGASAESPPTGGDGRGGRGRGGSGVGTPGGRPAGGMFGGGAPDEGGPAGMPDPEEMERMQRIVGELLQAQPRLTITQGRDEITFIQVDGHVRTLATNGRKQKTQLMAATVETRVKWNGNRLEQEYTFPKGRVRYRFAAVGSEQLAIDVEPPSGPMATGLKLRWVYDRLR